MKFLKYLNLNLQPLRCGFDHQAYEPDRHCDLKFQSFGQVKSSSQLETIIIGCKLLKLDLLRISFNSYS